MQKLQPLKNGHFGSKIKIKKKLAKNDSTMLLELFCAKAARKITKYSRNEMLLKIGHHGIIFSLGQKLKLKKNMRKTIL